jgi:hypothetical protein
MMYRPDRKENAPLSPERMAHLGKNCEEMAKAGVLVLRAGLRHKTPSTLALPHNGGTIGGSDHTL